MKGMTDYSGEFDPGLNFEDFSGGTLVNLMELYSRLLVSLDGFWYLAVKNSMGNEGALACDNWAWDRVLKKYMVDDIARILDIRGNDVVDFMKILQARPIHFVIKEKISVKNRNDAVLTVVRCPTLEALEREGEGRDASHCENACSIMRLKHAQLFNPKIEVDCLKIPPRRSKDDTFCEWEYVIRQG